jgi:hypothetical protein
MNLSGNLSGNMSGNLSGNMNQSGNFNQSGSTMRSQQAIPVAPGSAQKKNRQNQSQTSSSLGIKKVVKKDFSRVHLTKVRDTPTGLALLPPGFLKDSGNYSPRHRETEVYTPKRSPRMDSSRRMDGGASFQQAASTTIGGHSISQTHTMTQNFGGEASTFYSSGSGMVGGGLTRSVVLDSGGVSGGVQSQSFQTQAYQTGMSTTSSRTLQDSRGNDLGRGGGIIDAGDSMTGGDSILSTNRGPSKFKLASDYAGVPNNSGDLVQYGLNDPVKRSPYDNAGAFLFDDPNSPVVKSLLAGEIVEVEAFGGQPLSQLSGGYSNFNLNAGVSSGSLNMGSSMDMEAIHGNRHHFSEQMDGLVGTSPSKHQAERKALPYLSNPRAAAAVMPPPQTPPVEGNEEGKESKDGSKTQNNSSTNDSGSKDSANKKQDANGSTSRTGSQAGSPRSVANFPPVAEFGAVISPRDPIPVIQSPRRLNETGSSFPSDMNNPVTAALNHLAMRSRVDGHSPNSTRSPFRSPGDAVDTEEEVDGVLTGRITDPTIRIPVSFGGGVGGPNSTATGSTGMRATNASIGVVSVMSHAGSNANLSNAHMNSTGMDTMMNTGMNTGMGASGMGVNTMMNGTSMSTGRVPGINPGNNMMSTTLPSMGGQIAGNNMNANNHSNNPFAVNNSQNNSINFTNTVASGVSGGSQTLSGGNISGGNSFHGSHTGSQGGLVAGSSTTRSVSFLNGGNSMQSNGSQNINGGNSTGSAAPTFYGNTNSSGSNTGSTTLGNTNTGTYGTSNGNNLPNTSVPVLSPNTETNPSGHLQDSVGDEGYLQFLQIKKEQENRARQKQKQREDEESARKQRATQRRTGVVPGSGSRNANASSGYREGKHEQGLQHSNSALNNSGLSANANDQVDQHLRAVASHKQRAYMEALGSEMWDQNHLSQNGHATNQGRSRANSKGSSRGIGGGVGSRGNSMNTSNSNIIISNPSQVMGASSQPLVYVGNSQNSQNHNANSSQHNGNAIQVPAGPGILMPSQIELSQSQPKLPRVVPKY